MSFDPPPATAAWLHREARSGFEMVHFGDTEGGFCLEGRTAAIESRHAWVVDYEINLNHQWVTRVAAINSRTALGIRSTVLEADGHGQWRVDGEAAPQLEGCLDVDLEASAFTNALPVRRLQLAVGDRALAPAAYLRALDVSVERLEDAATPPARGFHHRFARHLAAAHRVGGADIVLDRGSDGGAGGVGAAPSDGGLPSGARTLGWPCSPWLS